MTFILLLLIISIIYLMFLSFSAFYSKIYYVDVNLVTPFVLFIFPIFLVLIFICLLFNFMCWLDNTSSWYKIQREQNDTQWKVNLLHLGPSRAHPSQEAGTLTVSSESFQKFSKYIRKCIIHIIFTEMLSKHTHCSLHCPSHTVMFLPYEVYVFVVNSYIYVP